MTTRVDWSTSTLRERLTEILRLRGLSSNALARAAGIDQGTMSRLGRKTLQGEPETLRRVANAGRVSFEWLATGVGLPEAPTADAKDPYPNRQEAARIARAGGIEERAVQAILATKFPYERDPSVLWWIHQFEGRAVLERTGIVPPREPAITPPASSGPRRTRRPPPGKTGGDEF